MAMIRSLTVEIYLAGAWHRAGELTLEDSVWENMFFGKTGSVARYYSDQSYGKLKVLSALGALPKDGPVPRTHVFGPFDAFAGGYPVPPMPGQVLPELTGVVPSTAEPERPAGEEQ